MFTKKFLQIISCVIIFFSGIAHAGENNFSAESPSQKIFLQNLPDNKKIFANWWENEIITAIGHGIAKKNQNNLPNRPAARRTAIMDAQRNLAAQVAEIKITANSGIVKAKIDAIIKGAQVISENFDENGNCEVVMQVPVYGVTNSVAKIAFTPAEKENFLPPSNKNQSVKGNYTGLIIDCGNIEINPVLSPVICNSKMQAIYSSKNLDYDKILQSGMIGYVQKKSAENNFMLLNYGGKNIFYRSGEKIMLLNSEEKNNSRTGNNPLVIKVTNLSDDSTCPVISQEDADKILAENQVSHFLDNGAVVFTSYRISGGRF